MIDWFRSWHGAPTDTKWLVIAKRAGVAPGIVSAVVWALLDHASQQTERGHVDGFDFETYATFSGFDEDHVRAIYAALEAKAIIVDGRIAQWEKRQPRREDTAVGERVRKHRKGADSENEPPLPLVQKDESVPAPSVELSTQNSEPLISPQAIQLADEIAVIAGHDLKFVPPAWCGAAARVQVWLKAGWQPSLIVDNVRAQMHRKRDGPPDRIQYFEKGIAIALARADAPLPVVKPVEPEVINAKIGNGGGFAGLALALCRQAAAERDGDVGRDHGSGALHVIDGSRNP